MEFKIVKTTNYDAYNRIDDVCYKIKYKTTFLGFEIWKHIRHEVCEWADVYQRDMTFSTIEDAQKHIEKMCEQNRIKFQRTEKTVVDIIKCNDI